MTSDERLQADVVDELAWEPQVDAAHIGVTAKNGVVTLLGHVGSFAEKYAAELAARRVRGVRGIAQEIEVHLPEHKKRADDEIAGRAVAMLGWDAGVPSERIQVKVERGYVTLTGEVDWNYQKDEVERAVRKLSGVTGIRNAIVVTPKLDAPDVRQRIRSALERDAALEAAAISVTTVGSTVVLTGRVRGLAERDAAERAAWSAPGVTKVEDRITIGF
jgi:osmotically-inducible protein OsmY